MTDEQFLLLVQLLTEIRDTLLIAFDNDAPESGQCQHPDENRVSLATPGMPDHWVCSLCRFENGVGHS